MAPLIHAAGPQLFMGGLEHLTCWAWQPGRDGGSLGTVERCSLAEAQVVEDSRREGYIGYLLADLFGSWKVIGGITTTDKVGYAK